MASAALAPSMASGEGRRSPNILFVFTDQHRRQSLGFMGQDPVVTPRLDRFAQEGMVLPNAVSNRPICSPYRAMMLTGKFPPSLGFSGNCNSVWPENYLRESERCISDVLHDAGYDCGFIGKWHLDVPDGPRTGGWENGNWDAYTPPGPKRHNFNFWYAYGCMFDYMRPHFWVGNAGKDEKTIVEQWEPEHEADVAIRYIQNRGGKTRDPKKPFALFVAPHPPHPPCYPVPEKYLKVYKDVPAGELLSRPNLCATGGKADSAKAEKARKQAEKMVHGYFAMVTGVDEQFGRILDCLKQEGLERDTIVVFTSDHGEMLGSHSLFGKSVFYDESALVPFIVRYPGRIAPGRDDMPLGAPDVMPTLLGLAGLENMIPGAVEGGDYSGVLTGQSSKRPEGALLMSGMKAGGIRTARHLFEMRGNKRGKDECHLFDMRRDPYQMDDVAGKSRKLVKELKARTVALARDVGAI